MNEPILAQVTAAVADSLKPYGIAGICVAFFMGRDLWRDARDAKREEQRAKEQEQREIRRDGQLTDLVLAVGNQTQALNRLTQAMTLEVLTRPGVVQRAKDEALELQSAVRRE